MISFRYHIVSIVAVFLALAVGITVGTTALNGPVTSDLRKQVNTLKSERSTLDNQITDLQKQVDNAGQFASTFGAQLVAGKLKGKSLLIISMPGVATGIQDGITAQIAAAGAQVSGRMQLAHDYIDQSSSGSIATLATSGTQPIGLSYPVTSDARELGAALLSYVLLGGGQPTDLRTTLSAFSALHMISNDPRGIEPAKIVVVIGSGTTPKGSYAGQAELDLVTALQARGAQTVVAGDAGSATGDGVVSLVRASPAKTAISTVDNADTAFGQVSTVLALVDAQSGRVGQYGTADGADALFPIPTG